MISMKISCVKQLQKFTDPQVLTYDITAREVSPGKYVANTCLQISSNITEEPRRSQDYKMTTALDFEKPADEKTYGVNVR